MLRININKWAIAASIVVIILVGTRYYFQRDAQSDLHVELATLDVDYAACVLLARKFDYERLTTLKGQSIAESQYISAKFSYELAQVEMKRAKILLELTERTGRYYGLGGRASVP